jgi:glycosyltransferase involved in cell wall biosynthesis
LHILLLSSGKVLGVPAGGEDRNTVLLGKWLAKQGYHVTLMGIEYAGLRVRHLSNNTENHVQNNIENDLKKRKKATLQIQYFSYSFRAIIWLFQVIKILLINLKNPITLIHAQDSGYTGLASVAAGKILNIPILITIHGIRYKEIESNPFINKIIKGLVLKIEHNLDVYTLRNANLVTVVSPLMRDYLVHLIDSGECAIFIPNAIKLRNFEFSETGRNRVRKELGISKDDKVIGYVGRLSPEKNLSTLLNAFASATLDNLSLRLILVGGGPLEDELLYKVTELKIQDKVIFSGVRHDVGDILSSFDIFVLPSFIEGFSIALLEAMACSRAIVCSNIPQNRELVTDNQEGLLINPDNHESMRTAILLLSNDEKLRQKLGYNAKTKASQYDEDFIFSRFVEHYETLSTKYRR